MLLMMLATALAADLEFAVSSPGEVHLKAAADVVHVPACRGVTWDRFDDEKGVFVAVPGETCHALADAIKIDSEGHSFVVNVRLPPLPKEGFHVVRPVVVYGLKCKDETPFPLSACDDFGVVKGPQLILRNRGLRGEQEAEKTP
jgi:hypothetical protein